MTVSHQAGTFFSEAEKSFFLRFHNIIGCLQVFVSVPPREATKDFFPRLAPDNTEKSWFLAKDLDV